MVKLTAFYKPTYFSSTYFSAKNITTRQLGFTTHFYSVKIGTKILPSKYMYTMLKDLDLGRDKKSC